MSVEDRCITITIPHNTAMIRFLTDRQTDGRTDNKEQAPPAVAQRDWGERDKNKYETALCVPSTYE